MTDPALAGAPGLTRLKRPSATSEHDSPETKCLCVNAPSQGSSADFAVSQLSLLHSDLLGHLFAFIPFRPRLFVVSCVSKRWRRLVLNSFYRLPPLRWSSNIQEGIRLFSRLSSITIPPQPRLYYPLPSDIKHLVMKRVAYVYAIALRSLTSLATLELFNCGVEGVDLVFVLRASSSTLTSLSLNEACAPMTPLTVFLDTAYFPHLVDLDIFTPVEPKTAVQHFISAHTSQLTSLSVQALRLVADDVLFPRLTRFGVSFYDTARLSRFLERNTTITSLHLKRAFSVPLLTPYPTITTVLESVAFESPERQLNLRAFDGCTRLSTLQCPNQSIMHSVLPPALCAQLTSLDLQNAASQSPGLLASFPNLTSLKFRSVSLSPEDTPISLPHLRSLTWREDVIEPGCLQHVVLAGCPLLQSLRLTGWQERASLRDFGMTLQQNGVESLIIVADFLLARQQVRELCRSFKWIWVRVVPPHEAMLV